MYGVFYLWWRGGGVRRVLRRMPAAVTVTWLTNISLIGVVARGTGHRWSARHCLKLNVPVYIVAWSCWYFKFDRPLSPRNVHAAVRRASPRAAPDHTRGGRVVREEGHGGQCYKK